MNVLVTNQQEALLSGLKVEIIKTMRGEYDAEEIIGTFSNFFFGKMILDLTAIKNYDNIANIQKISIGLPVEKIILVLPPNGNYSNNIFISKLISMGFYNFTTNLEGVEYLIDHPNTYKDVAHMQQLETPNYAIPNQQNNNTSNNQVTNQQEIPKVRIIAFKSVTDGAGSTTLIVTIKKELEKFHNFKVKAIEVGKRDFIYFNDSDLVSINKTELISELSKCFGYDLVLVDINDMEESSFNEIYYLIEPSIIKINKLIKRDKKIFDRLKDKHVIVNKSMISNEEIAEFALETGLKIFTAIRPFNDRSKTQVLNNLLNRLGIIHMEINSNNNHSSKLGGIFGH